MTTAAHSHKSRTRLYLFIGVLLSVLATFGIRYYAGAAQVTEREQFGDLVYEMSDDDMVGFTIKSQKIRYEQRWDAGPPPGNPLDRTFRALKLDRQKRDMEAVVKDTYGWDVSSSADRKSILDEANRLHQVLHTIPDSTLKEEEYGAWSKLRDIVDMLTGVSECHGRCLPERPGVDDVFYKVVPLVAIGTAIAAIQGEYAHPSVPKEQVDAVVAALAVVHTVAAAVVTIMIRDLFRIQTRTLKNAVMGALFVTLATLRLYKDDAGELAKARSSTPKDDAKEGAKDLSALTPEPDDAPKDYDMVHDEL